MDFFIIGVILLSGCVMETDEISTLKIKVLNLESIVNTQDKKIAELENRINSTEKKISEEISGKFLEAQSKILVELNDLRKDLTLLQSKLEEIQFQSQAQNDLQRKTLEDITTRLSALELKIKDLEGKLSQPRTMESISPSNQTYSNETSLPKPSLSNQTISNQTASTQTKAQEPSSLMEKKKEPKPKEEDLYQKAFSLYEKGDLKGAKALWEEYLRVYPKGKWVPQTHFYLGEIYFKEKDYETAILEYQKLIETPGPNPLKPKALLRQAEAFLALKDKKAAEILLKKLIKTYPTTKEAKEAQEKLKKLK